MFAWSWTFLDLRVKGEKEKRGKGIIKGKGRPFPPFPAS
jgi:hypothetical protein